MLIILCSILTVWILYSIFYAYAPLIHSGNLPVLPQEIAPYLRNWTLDHDGMEMYVLYALALVALPLTFFLTYFFHRAMQRGRYIRNTVYVLLTITALFFAYLIGFHPPGGDAFPLSISLIFSISIISFVIWWLIQNVHRFPRLFHLAIFVLLIPAIFIPTSFTGLFDYSYIFAPTYKLLHHINLSEIYFQYDLFLSLLAGVWMKLHLNLQYFRIVGQLGTYIFILAAFFLSKKIFVKKELAYYLLFVLVFVKVYTAVDPTALLQCSPLRLDLWIVLAVIAYWKGLQSWLVSFVIGILLLITPTFGLIYLAAYLETLTVLCILECTQVRTTFLGKLSIIRDFLKNNLINVAIILGFFIASKAMVSTYSMEAASLYRKIGIGFLPISPTSFYWYVFAFLSIAFLVIIKNRELLTKKYFSTAIFFVFLAIGNSLYYFGRSHENNIILISGSLIFVLFIFIDILAFKKGKLVNLLPISIVVVLLFSYSRISYERLSKQISKIQSVVAQSQSVAHITSGELPLDKVKRLTNNSPNVYFMSVKDGFYLDYYGGYEPRGFYYPYGSWVYKKELLSFLQVLLVDHYYLVIPAADMPLQAELLSGLQYNKTITDTDVTIISD